MTRIGLRFMVPHAPPIWPGDACNKAVYQKEGASAGALSYWPELDSQEVRCRVTLVGPMARVPVAVNPGNHGGAKLGFVL